MCAGVPLLQLVGGYNPKRVAHDVLEHSLIYSGT